ncbi:MAG TPA: ATP-binding cassette domain-containing protein [Thermoanaerobaculia bacterium]|nr:ATP-binding cassette domain-containing protein [Thermoanaerobaculia bacterium]
MPSPVRADGSLRLRVEKVSKTYANGVRALAGVSLEIPRGMFGLLGPNGAGKSTLMRILATLQEPDEGSVHLDGAGGDGGLDVVRDKRALRETLGYLPQDFGLYPRVRAEELLAHFAALEGVRGRRARREVVERLLRQVGMWEVRRRKLGGFSGGMRQRFGIAVALLGEPRLLIVDEPTAGLDPAERVRFLNLLSELGEQSVVLLSTHIVDDVAELCTRMAVIDRGEILFQAEPLAAVAALAGRVWGRVVERAELPEVERRRAVLSTRLSAGRTLVRVLADAAPEPGFEPVEPTLGDVYFAALAGRRSGPPAAGGPGLPC